MISTKGSAELNLMIANNNLIVMHGLRGVLLVRRSPAMSRQQRDPHLNITFQQVQKY